MDTHSDQLTFSQNLQLLKHLRYSDHDSYPVPTSISSKDNEACLLDLVAISFATGAPGEAISSAFDTRNPERLILALFVNREVEALDHQATVSFSSAVSTAKSWRDLTPFIAWRSAKLVNKRIRKIQESLGHFKGYLKTAIKKHKFRTMEEEFPHSSGYRRRTYPDMEPSPTQFLRDLLRCLKDSPDIDVGDKHNGYNQLHRLIVVTDILRHSRFLAYFWGSKPGSKKLVTRLEKLSRYTRLNRVIAHAKRLPAGIQIQWVMPSVKGTGVGFVDIRGAAVIVERIICSLRSLYSLPSQNLPALMKPCLAAISKEYPGWEVGWKESFTTCLHAEVCIILYFMGPGCLSVEAFSIGEEIPIGCSKRSCFCCTTFIRLLNKSTKMCWVRSRWSDSGKVCVDWALPGSGVDKTMSYEVSDRLHTQLAFLQDMPNWRLDPVYWRSKKRLW